MPFHYTDEAIRIHMPPTNTYAGLIPKNHDLVEEMVLKNNTLVMRRRRHHQNSDRRGGGSSSSGFSHFFDKITGRFQIKDSSDNPRAVPDQSNNYGLPRRTSANTINPRSCNNKRSAEEQRGGDRTLQSTENNKKLKAIFVDDQSNQELITPQGDDSLVPDSATPIVIGSIKSAHHDHLVPGPDMSIAASNTDDTIHQHSDDSSAYLESQQWSDEDEDQESARRTSYYRSRNRSSLHSPSEKKRRYRINKKMRALQELLPNSNKVDKASVLDEAIEYVKSLQLQLQLLSSGAHMLTSPMMMPQIPMPNLNHFSAAAAAATMGLGMRPNQFPISAMHGFPHMSCFPYMPPFLGGPSMRSAMAVPVVPETTLIDQTAGSIPPMSGPNYSSYPNDFSQIGFESELRHN